MALEKKQHEQLAEFVYYAAVEILTHITFREDRPELTNVPNDQPCEAPSPIGDAVAHAFNNHSVASWLKYVMEKSSLYAERKAIPTDLWMLASMKFLWHCWSNKHFQHHLDNMNVSELLQSWLHSFLIGGCQR
jgi:hypothetical protein